MKKGKKIVIVGAGFAGLETAKALKGSEHDVLVLDKTNHHLFQPLLYQVASAALSPADIAYPIRAVFRNQENIDVRLTEVLAIDKQKREVITDSGNYPYDMLVLAPGSRHSYFGNDQWEEHAPGLKTLRDALRIRENTLSSFEAADKIEDEKERKKFLTFVVVGGGPTGVEMAGAIAEISKQTIVNDFKRITPEDTRVILVEGASRILTAYSEHLSEDALSSLRSMGVEVLLNSMVTGITSESIQTSAGEIPTKNIIWAAGNQASPLIKQLNTETDKMGRAVVGEDLSIPGHPEIFVLGDSASYATKDGSTLPGTCPVAMQMGKYVGALLKKDAPVEKRKKFSYFDKGSMATIGRARAIANIQGFQFSGFIAWLMWSFIHVFFLISFRNRFKVMAEWVWFYITFKQGTRLITGKDE